MLRDASSLVHYGQLPAAGALCDQILALQPANFEALQLRGVIAAQLKDLRGAEARLRGALALKPDDAHANFNLGCVLHEARQLEAALDCYDRAVLADPGFVNAYFNRGTVLHALKRPEAALASYDKAVELKPDFAEAHSNRGILLAELKCNAAAIESFDRAIGLRPEYPEAYANRGLALRAAKRLDEALADMNRAIALRPAYAEAFSNRGHVQVDLRNYAGALGDYDISIALKPEYAKAHSGRGTALMELDRLEEALAAYDRAIKLDPGFAEAHCNRGVLLQKSGRLEAARASLDRAAELDPDSGHTQFNRAVARLQAGDFATGWPLYEWRWKNEKGSVISQRRDFPQPLWLGEVSLAGKTILLHSEQGLGDAIQFCRFARSVAERGARVILEAPRPLLPLLVSLNGVSQLIARGDPLPPFDLHCPLMSLPLALRIGVDGIPFSEGYLRGEPHLAARWRARLGEHDRPRIGLAWSGNPQNTHDRTRSIPLSLLITYLPAEFQYVSLQRDVRDRDLQTLADHPQIRHHGEELDFGNTAALCECLDLVISVDTSLAHLSGALGKRTWILLSFHPDWRWMLDRGNSPWYATATLFRQRMPADWIEVLQRLSADLRHQFAH